MYLILYNFEFFFLKSPESGTIDKEFSSEYGERIWKKVFIFFKEIEIYMQQKQAILNKLLLII